MTAQPSIRILQPGDEQALEAFLRPRLEASMFLVSNSRTVGLHDSGQRYEGTYAAAFDDDLIVGVVAHYWNQFIIMQAPACLDDLWRAAVTASCRPVGGLIGPAAQVSAVEAALSLRAEQIQADETEYLYSLSLDALVEPTDLRLGNVRGRRIAPRDLDLATDWRVAYSIEALKESDGPSLRAKCRASMEVTLREGSTWILEDASGQPVAQSSFNATTVEAVQIGGVWTPPSLRGRGYGRAVVAASLRDARAEGKEWAVLFTGIHNVPAQKAYEALGFQHIGDYRIVILRQPIQGVNQTADI